MSPPIGLWRAENVNIKTILYGVVSLAGAYFDVLYYAAVQRNIMHYGEANYQLPSRIRQSVRAG